jgi:hypothetical protein
MLPIPPKPEPEFLTESEPRPEPGPTDLPSAVAETAHDLGHDAGPSSPVVRLALHAEPLVMLRDRVEAARAAVQPDLLHAAADALHALEVALRSGVALLKESYENFEHEYPDWLRRLDRSGGADAPRPEPAADEGEHEAP